MGLEKTEANYNYENIKTNHRKFAKKRKIFEELAAPVILLKPFHANMHKLANNGTNVNNHIIYSIKSKLLRYPCENTKHSNY